jgi:hypothetical protein
LRLAVLWLSLCVGAGVAAGQSQLSIQGDPAFGGDLELSVEAPGSVGQVVWLALGDGLLPLDEPISTGKGDVYFSRLLLAFIGGTVPGDGTFTLPFSMPAFDAGLLGLRLPAQAFVDGQLSNPAALLFDEPYLTQVTATTLTAPVPSHKAEFGGDVAVGDFDADGHRDVAVSAYKEDVGPVDQAGRVYVFWGPNHVGATVLTTNQPTENGFFGISLTVADVDGDLVDDLVVGETAGSPPVGIPRLSLFHGGPGFPASVVEIDGPGTGVQFSGYTHAVVAGDFDDDGDVDLAVSNNKAPLAGQQEAGQIDVYLGPGFTSVLTIPSPDPETDHGFASVLATADVNGDGIADIVEASPADDVGGDGDAGSIHVILGPSLAVGQPIHCPEPLGSGTLFGFEVHADDLDGDGETDLIAGDGKDRVFVLWGPSFTDWLTVPKPPASIPNPFGETAYAWCLESGDVNGDNDHDLIIADSFEGELLGCSAGNSGTVFVALAPYYSTFLRATVASAVCGDEFGNALWIGDLDQDNASELIVGAHFVDPGGVTNGGQLAILVGAGP